MLISEPKYLLTPKRRCPCGRRLKSVGYEVQELQWEVIEFINQEETPGEQLNLDLGCPEHDF